MSDTVFTNGVTLTDADWFNDVNRLHYTIFSDPADAAAVRTAVSVPSKAEIQNGTQVVLGSVAGTNTITASASPAPSAYASGQVFRLVPANTNTGATTLNLNSLGAKNIYLNNVALSGGELVANIPALVQYDGTQFQLLGLPSFSMVSTTRDQSTASGSQAITGAGFRPRFAILFASEVSTAKLSIGVAFGTTSFCVYNNHNASSNQWSNNTNIATLIQSGSDFNTVTVSSLDADGCTLSWTKTGSPTGTANIRLVFIR